MRRHSRARMIAAPQRRAQPSSRHPHAAPRRPTAWPSVSFTCRNRSSATATTAKLRARAPHPGCAPGPAPKSHRGSGSPGRAARPCRTLDSADRLDAKHQRGPAPTTLPGPASGAPRRSITADPSPRPQRPRPIRHAAAGPPAGAPGAQPLGLRTATAGPRAFRRSRKAQPAATLLRPESRRSSPARAEHSATRPVRSISITSPGRARRSRPRTAAAASVSWSTPPRFHPAPDRADSCPDLIHRSARSRVMVRPAPTTSASCPSREVDRERPCKTAHPRRALASDPLHSRESPKRSALRFKSLNDGYYRPRLINES